MHKNLTLWSSSTNLYIIISNNRSLVKRQWNHCMYVSSWHLLLKTYVMILKTSVRYMGLASQKNMGGEATVARYWKSLWGSRPSHKITRSKTAPPKIKVMFEDCPRSAIISVVPIRAWNGEGSRLSRALSIPIISFNHSFFCKHSCALQLINVNLQ